MCWLVLVQGEIIAGHGRVMAAQMLGMTEVPALALSYLSAAERRAYVLADNKLALWTCNGFVPVT